MADEFFTFNRTEDAISMQSFREDLHRSVDNADSMSVRSRTDSAIFMKPIPSSPEEPEPDIKFQQANEEENQSNIENQQNSIQTAPEISIEECAKKKIEK